MKYYIPSSFKCYDQSNVFNLRQSLVCLRWSKGDCYSASVDLSCSLKNRSQFNVIRSNNGIVLYVSAKGIHI